MVVSDVRVPNPKQMTPLVKGSVVRRRLLDKLHSNLAYNFQVIKSPAGYGKTTLLADFAREVEASVCWYNISDVDRDPVTFYEGLVQVIGQAFPSAALHGSMVTDGTPRALAGSLSDFISQIPDYFVLVIEDVHIIAKTLSGELIDCLIDTWSDNGHLVVSTRQLDDFDRINDHIARQQAACLSASDLMFLPDEVKLLAKERHSVEINDIDARHLTEQLDGWPLGISLALNSSSGINVLHAAGRNIIFDFLTRQVLKQQSKATQKLLLGLSTFIVIEPDLCGEVLCIPNFRKKIRQLLEGNLFITETGPESYQYHQLFREFLQTSLKEGDSDLFYSLHVKAALKYEALGRFETAIEHFLIGRNFDEAARLILGNGDKLFRQGRWTSVVNWVERLPDDVRTATVDMELLYAQCLVHTGEPNQAGQIITAILLDHTKPIDRITKAQALYTRSSACRLLGQRDQSRLDAEQAEVLLGNNESHKGLMGEINARLGHLYFDKSEFTQALQYFQKAKELFTAVFDVDNLAFVNNTLGGIYKNYGDLSQASTYYEYARQTFIKNGNRGNLSMVLVNIAYIQHKNGLHELVLDTLAYALENARASGYKRVETGITVALGEVYRDLGDHKKSIELLQEALAIARETQDSNFVAYSKAGLGETYRIIGDLEKAAYWTKEALSQAQTEQQHYEIALFQMQLAMINDRNEKHEEAVIALAEVYKKLLLIGDRDALARCCFAAASASFSQRNYESAVRWLGWMLGHIENLEYDDFAVIEGGRDPLLVQYAATKEIGGHYFERLMERIKVKRQLLATVKEQIPQKIHLTRLQGFGFNDSKIVFNDQVVNEHAWRSNRAKELVFFLLNNPGKSAEEIASQLWPELSPAKATSKFHINLFRARRAISPGIIIQENGRYNFSSEVELWYDVTEFEKQLREISRLAPEERDLITEHVIDLYKGALLPGFDSEWVSEKRYDLENKYLKLLFGMVGQYAKRGNMEKVVSLVERVLDTNSDDDEVYYQGIQAYLALGNSLSASHLYKRYLSNLKEIDAAPDTRFESLVGQLSIN